MSFKHEICFVGLKCYDLLKREKTPRYLGGIERVLVTLARGLVTAGVRVAFITYDHGQPAIEILDGITVIKSYAPNSGIKGLRFVHPRMTNIWGAMKVADAQTYLQMGAGIETAVVSYGTKWFFSKSRKFIFCLASDSDSDPAMPLLTSSREKLIYQFGLKSANAIVSQTQAQRNSLEKSFNLSSMVIPMPCEFQHNAVVKKRSHSEKISQGIDILWVGRTIAVKRLEAYLDLAEKCPEYNFHIVGASNAESEYSKNLVERAKKITNVIVHGKISDQELAILYSNAFLLCCTSVVEGFPTTFIEAWEFGLPIVSTFDPDGILKNNELAVVADVTTLKEAIDELKINELNYNDFIKRGRDFYNKNYTLNSVVPKYIDLLKDKN